MNSSTSTYYYKLKKGRALRAFENAQLRDEIEMIQRDFPDAGYRTVQSYLYRRKGPCSTHRGAGRDPPWLPKSASPSAYFLETCSDFPFSMLTRALPGMI